MHLRYGALCLPLPFQRNWSRNISPTFCGRRPTWRTWRMMHLTYWALCLPLQPRSRIALSQHCWETCRERQVFRQLRWDERRQPIIGEVPWRRRLAEKVPPLVLEWRILTALWRCHVIRHLERYSLDHRSSVDFLRAWQQTVEKTKHKKKYIHIHCIYYTSTIFTLFDFIPYCFFLYFTYLRAVRLSQGSLDQECPRWEVLPVHVTRWKPS